MNELQHLPQPAWLAKAIDYTLLSPMATTLEVRRLCDEAKEHGFWSVCVSPTHVRTAAEILHRSGVKVCSVVGFPLGFSVAGVKLVETMKCIEDGADEIDMVMNIGSFKSGRRDAVFSEIKEVADFCRNKDKPLKVILECCYLSDEEKVSAARIADVAGASFVKTSTGFGPSGATVHDVRLLAETVTRSKVKAAGGIGTLGQALQMLEAGASRLGTSSGVRIMDELAASLKDS
jgi:deoxyribose-phosphate aldolase